MFSIIFELAMPSSSAGRNALDFLRFPMKIQQFLKILAVAGPYSHPLYQAPPRAASSPLRTSSGTAQALGVAPCTRFGL